MAQISPFITSQTTIWRAAQGFHASHSLGAMLFGLVYLIAMTYLARQYWFGIPFRGVSISCAAYAGAWLASTTA